MKINKMKNMRCHSCTEVVDRTFQTVFLICARNSLRRLLSIKIKERQLLQKDTLIDVLKSLLVSRSANCLAFPGTMTSFDYQSQPSAIKSKTKSHPAEHVKTNASKDGDSLMNINKENKVQNEQKLNRTKQKSKRKVTKLYDRKKKPNQKR